MHRHSQKAMLQSQMLRPPYDVTYILRISKISENWGHGTVLWQLLVAVTYCTATVQCPLAFFAGIILRPYGDRTSLRWLYQNVRWPHGDRTANGYGIMLQSKMLRPPNAVSYLIDNWRHRRGLWQMLVAITYRTRPVRCPLPFNANYQCMTVRRPHDAFWYCVQG